MSAQFEPIEATRTSGQRSLESRVWVALTPNHNIDNRSDVSGRQSQTKVSFNEVMCKTSTSVYNHATRVGAPAPIVIEKFLPRLEEQEENMENNRTGHAEKLLPWFEEQGSMGSSRSSLRFSAISEERLSAAIRLAKLDLRRRRPGSLNSSSSKPPEDEDPRGNSNVDSFQRNPVSIGVKQRTLSPKEKTTRPVPKLLVHTHQKKPISISIGNGLSPPTRDPGPRPLARGKQPQLNQDICKIQKELGAYIQKIETLANRGPNIEEPLEPDEQLRIEVRKQRQAARSARIIYSLQRQVKEAQDAIEITCSQEVSETRKFKAMGRLVATHRAAVRAIQVFIHQLSGPSDGSMPPHLKELGQLLRQLSLCSAKVEVDQGSTIPETTLEILQKLETLDSVLSKQERPQKRQVRARSLSPPRCKSPRHSMSPPRASRGLSLTGFQGPHKAAGPKKSLHGWRLASKNQRRVPARPAARGQVLRAGLQTLVQQGKLSEETNTEPEPNSKGEAPERGKVRDAGFQQPTVSSRLRVSQMPQKEHCVPWMPASPHSPPHPQGSSQRRRPEPRCLFSPLKPPESPSKQKVPKGPGAEQCTTSDRKNQAHSEALRQAWLDKMTMQRLKELNQLTKEEMERIQTLRLQVGSPTQWAERAEQKAREKIQPLLDEVQVGGIVPYRPLTLMSFFTRHRATPNNTMHVTEPKGEINTPYLLLKNPYKRVLYDQISATVRRIMIF